MTQLTPNAEPHNYRSAILGALLITVIVGFMMVAPSTAAAATYTVNSTADSVDVSPGNGVCADSLARCTLRAAVMEANATVGANTINVPAGTYTLTIGPFDDDFNLLGANQASGDLDILNNNLTIVGAGSALTIIDGNGIDRVIDVNSSSAGGPAIDVTLQDLTIRNGIAPTAPSGFRETGGGIKFDGTDNNTGLPVGTLTITNCRVMNNTAAGQGGGVQAFFGSLVVTGSEVSGNVSLNAAGGGILYDGGSPAGLRNLQITNSTFAGNRTPRVTFGNGAGMSIGGNATKTVNYNVITNNNAAARGGGVFNNNGPLTLNFNVIVGNTATADATSTGFRNTSGTINGQNNWWGCNSGPAFSVCDRASGPVGFGILQWLYLNHKAIPNPMLVNTSGTLQADFYTNNTSAVILPTDLVALEGRAILFNNPVLGTISGADTQISVGKANATFNAGPTGGTGSADATVDHATSTVFIQIQGAPGVTVNPMDQTACAGDIVTFSAASSGFPPPTVQWQVSTNGGGSFSDIPGATSNTLAFTATASQDGNKYRAVFTNAAGSDTTTAATLTVNTAPTITTNPVDVTVCDGATATFTAAANGKPAPSVQWQVSSGGPFANIPGATSTTLSFTASAAQNGNKYRAVFTNSCGSATTTAATLTVNASTATSDPADQTVCQGASASFSTTATGAGPLHYAWTVDGSAFGGDTSSISVPTGSLSVGNHTVAVTTTGACGSASQSATLTVQENTATSDPADQTVCQGTNANFSTTATGTGPFHYAWTVDGSSFGGDTSSISVPTGSLSIGNHTVAVTTTGTCGSASQSATLTVQENTSTTDPADQTVCQGATANFSTTTSGTGPFSYSWTVDGSPAGGNSASLSVPTGSLSVGNHTVAVTVTGTCGSASQSATLTVQGNTATSDPADQTVCEGATATFSTTATGTGPFHYAWTVDGSAFGGDTSSITVGPLAVGNHTVAVTTTGTCGSAPQSAMLTVNANTTTTDPSDQTVCQGANATFSTTAGGTGPFHYAWTVDGSAFGGDTSSITVPTGSLSVGSHTVAVTTTGACGNASQSATLTVNANTATSDPPDQTVCQGATASFSTTATGTGPFHYAWTVDGSAFGGDTSSISVATGSLTTGTHTVSVTTTGACGSASQSATLTVNANTATTDPPDRTVCQGSTTSFTTSASGTGPFTFVWKKGVTVLTTGSFGGRVTITNTATTSTLTITNVQAGDAGAYTVETTGACGTATQSSNLTVNSTPPGIVLTGNNIELWPPNHSYHTINVTDLVASASSCDGTVNLSSVVIDTVTSDEVENGNGDGNTYNDIVIACDRKSVQLRAERDGSGDGRVYTITFKVTDSFGVSTTATAKVTVPKNQNGSSAVDSGVHYIVTNASCP